MTHMTPTIPTTTPMRILITAGPTHEPIDAVRYIGNRSSGRVGIALADEAARRGHHVTLLLGPVHLCPAHPAVKTHPFRTCENLRTLLAEHAPGSDVIIMAAAVADYRPLPSTSMQGGKFRRADGPLTLQLESTPDLIAEIAAHRRPGQFLIAFALEPRAEMVASAQAKLARKRVDLVIANPLETMDSDAIEAIAVHADGHQTHTGTAIPKSDFAPWLLDLLDDSMP